MQAPKAPSEASANPDEHLSDLSFSELDLMPELARGIADAGFTKCTPIQMQSLPLALSGKDVAGQAQTGTGKTAAYLIALFQYLANREPLTDARDCPRALVLAPTRELAIQIHEDAKLLGAHVPFKLALAYGGTDYEKQRSHIESGVDVLIATPGRLIDYFKQKVFQLRGIQVLVIDEADRMFDLGFIKDIRYLLRRLPERDQRLNLLFSATLSHRVLELAYEHMNEPDLVRIDPDKMTVDRVNQRIYFPSNDEKIPLLITLLRQMQATRTMIFVNTKRSAERVCDHLEFNGIQAAAISGDVPQRKRQSMLSSFQSGELAVLIGTDVASRGLHVPDVSHVFNFDLPQDAEDYVHRIGRTARAGATGDAVSFGCEDYVVSLPEIESYIGRKIPVESFDRTGFEDIKPAPRRKRREDDKRRGGNRRDERPRRPSGGSRNERAESAGTSGHSSQSGQGGHSGAGEQPRSSAPQNSDPARKKRRRRRRPNKPAE